MKQKDSHIIKRIALLTSLLIAFSLQSKAIETAAQLISKCANTVNNAPSLVVKATVSAAQESFVVNMTLSRERFVFDYPQMKVWYDGTTQWTYIKGNRELNITEPTQEELLEINPFAILNFYRKAYTARRLESTTPTIELVAKEPTATIRKAVITIDPANDMPSKIVVTFSNGHTLTATITSITRGKTKSPSAFIFDKDKYPTAEIVDLR